MTRTARRHALLVATFEYADPDLQQLRAIGRDAMSLAGVLADPQIGGFHVQTLINVPSAELQEKIEEFCAGRHPDDLLLVYLSCHGLLDDSGALYYAATNTRRQREATTAVAATWLSEQLADCRARHQLVVLDCCYSGAAALGARADAGLAPKQRFRPRGRGRAVLTASRNTEYSFAGHQVSGHGERGERGARSVFTNAIADGLRTGDADEDGDGLITVTDLYRHVYDRVRLAEPRQSPELWLYGAEADLLVARSSRGDVIENRPARHNLAHANTGRLAWARLGASRGKLTSRPSRPGLLLIVIPTLAAVALAGIRSVSAVRSAVEYQGVVRLATLGSAVTDLAQHLEDERDQTVYDRALGRTGRARQPAGLRGLQDYYGHTDGLRRQVVRGLRAVGKPFPVQTQQQAQLSASRLDGLPALRDASTRTALPALVVMQKYTSLIEALLQVDDQLATNSADPALDDAARMLSLISRIDEAASEQRALLAEALATGSFAPGVLAGVSDAQVREQAILQVFQATATPGQLALYQNQVSSPSSDRSAGEEDLAINLGQEGKALGSDATTAREWMASMTVTVNLMRKVESDLVHSALSRARALRRSAIIGGITSATLLVLLALFAVVAGFPMIRPR